MCIVQWNDHSAGNSFLSVLHREIIFILSFICSESCELVYTNFLISDDKIDMICSLSIHRRQWWSMAYIAASLPVSFLLPCSSHLPRIASTPILPPSPPFLPRPVTLPLSILTQGSGNWVCGEASRSPRSVSHVVDLGWHWCGLVPPRGQLITKATPPRLGQHVLNTSFINNVHVLWSLWCKCRAVLGQRGAAGRRVSGWYVCASWFIYVWLLQQ